MHSISISHPFPLLTDSLTNVIQSLNSNSKSSTKGGYRGVQVVRDGNKGLQVNNGRCRGVQGGRGGYTGVEVDRGGYWGMSQYICTFNS